MYIEIKKIDDKYSMNNYVQFQKKLNIYRNPIYFQNQWNRYTKTIEECIKMLELEELYCEATLIKNITCNNINYSDDTFIKEEYQNCFQNGELNLI